jgi:lipoprotein-anchoring transpeptidase ErfK/SrfK
MSVAVLVTLAVMLSACSSNTMPGPTTTVTRAAASSTATAAAPLPSTSATTSTPPKPTGKPVHVSSAVLSDGSTVGVGLPIILLLSRPITSAKAFAAATRVTVNGRRVSGGWYFERKYGDKGHPIEADYRLPNYWPGHAQIHLGLKVKGLSAGPGLQFANDLSLDFATGAANIATVDNATHRLTVISDGNQWPNASTTFPVSLGASNTPTRRGTKVIMEKGASICMSGPGYHECDVRYTQRLTYDGEYLHSAPWNCLGSPGCIGPQHNIGSANSSNGCTNLTPRDAQRLYDFLEIGDVVKFPNADGPLMALGDGYGDWNVPWPQWRTGGLYAVA